jgi:hypothetical protein
MLVGTFGQTMKASLNQSESEQRADGGHNLNTEIITLVF